MGHNFSSTLEKKEKRAFRLMCFLGAVLLLATRALTLTFHMEIHPDEWVFFYGTDSLLNCLLYGTEFQEVKEYPEGAYLLHLPFMALGRFFGHLTGREVNIQLWGRISSACWFTMAVVLGMYLQYRYLGKNRTSALFFLLIMCFSMFFLEHSRYGVGDMISLFLLMAVVAATGKWCENRRSMWWLFFAGFLSGALGAVKYPQLYFGLIPLGAWLLVSRDKGKACLPVTLGLLMMLLLGLLAFSPKAILDWTYFYRVIQREMGAYVYDVKSGGVHNTAIQLILHHLLFTEFPLAFLLLAVTGIRRLCGWVGRKGKPISRCPVEVLFLQVLPLVIFGFFFYNLFVTNFTMRTMTPYLGVCPLYTAWIVSRLYSRGGWKKAFVSLLTIFLVLRGVVMMGLLSTNSCCRDFASEVKQVLAEQNGQGRVITVRTNYIPHKEELFADTDYQDVGIGEFEEFYEYDLELRPGDVLIASALDYSGCLLPVKDPGALSRYHAWEAIKQANGEHFVSASTSGWPYYLQGAAIRGDSFASFTYPRVYLYYRPLGT